MTATISDVDETIRQIRTSIFELGAGDGTSVRMQVISLIRQLSEAIGFDVRVMFDGPVDTSLSTAVAEHLLAVTREAVTNVGRHAGADEAAVYLTVDDRICQLRVIDNGCGVAAAGATTGGLGLGNMRHRAEKLGGVFTLEDRTGGGTVLTWQVPLSA